jgi:ferredoxin
MKIKVDFDLCESNALCEALAPSHFQIDDDDFLQVLDENVTDADLDSVRQAVAACPKSAISLVED